jgi:hypothetical protein
MIKRRLLPALALLLGLLLAPLPAQAQAETLTIRMVRASQGTEIDPALQDVAALMRGNLAFSAFKLLDSATVTLPASAPVRLNKSYKVSLSGPASSLDITVTHGTVALIKTHAVLQGRSPLVLGGIPSRDGTLLFVLKLVK